MLDNNGCCRSVGQAEGQVVIGKEPSKARHGQRVCLCCQSEGQQCKLSMEAAEVCAKKKAMTRPTCAAGQCVSLLWAR